MDLGGNFTGSCGGKVNLLHKVRKFMRQKESYNAGVGKIGREIYFVLLLL